MRETFPSEVAEKLRSYVYRLIDPRNGETFYVGKGKGDRLFHHIRLAEDESFDTENDKVRRIREILDEGLEVGHVIHRHGMSDETACEVEAALIDAYPGLSNIAGGQGNSDFGVMHSDNIIKRYSAETAEIVDPLLLIILNDIYSNQSIYDQTRFAWRLDPNRAKRAKYVAAIKQGLIIEVFEVDEWLQATPENFKGRTTGPGRWAFNGRLAPENVRKRYLNKRIPERYRKRGSSNPIRYTYK